MAYNYEYPYVDPNRHNADWILNKMRELEGRLDGIVEEALMHTKEYVDECIVNYQSQITEIKREIMALNGHATEISEELVTEAIRLENLIAEAERKAENLFIIANNRTDMVIERNNEYIFRVIGDELFSNIAVINYFTGEQMSVQNMFDYLASLHLANAITYFSLREKNLKYNALVSKSVTYTELVKNGATLL